MSKYELMYILNVNTSDERKAQLQEKFTGIIEADGQVEKIDIWGQRKLAYEIKKLNEGYYVLIHFESSIDVPKEIDRNLKIADEVIRHMIVRK